MGEKIHFDENADLEANYTIINWHRSSEDGSVVFKEIGYYNMHARRGAKLLIDKTKIMWNGYNSEVSQIFSRECGYSVFSDISDSFTCHNNLKIRNRKSHKIK